MVRSDALDRVSAKLSASPSLARALAMDRFGRGSSSRTVTTADPLSTKAPVTESSRTVNTWSGSSTWSCRVTTE